MFLEQLKRCKPDNASSEVNFLDNKKYKSADTF